MTRRKIIVTGSAAAIVLVGGILLATNDSASKPNTNLQTDIPASQSNEQINGSPDPSEENRFMQPDINNEEFILTASNVSCSTTEVNGVSSRSCSGNIHIVPKAHGAPSAGLYKINEHTKLLHDGQEQDLNTLQQLAQNQTPVRLTLAPGSEELLAEIRY